MNQQDSDFLTSPGSLEDPEATLKVLKKSVLQLWEVINDLTSLRPPKRQRYRVTIFGSGRIQPDSAIYQDVRWLASQLTQMQCDIVTGGGPGLMQAANEGSIMTDPENQTRSIGIRINLDSEQEANPFLEEIYRHRTFFSRLHQFVLISNAFIIMPGGFGTALEAFMIWQLLQVRHLENIPLIMVGTMWEELIAWANKHMINGSSPLANPEDIQIPYYVDKVEQVIPIIEEFHHKWLCSGKNQNESCLF